MDSESWAMMMPWSPSLARSRAMSATCVSLGEKMSTKSSRLMTSGSSSGGSALFLWLLGYGLIALRQQNDKTVEPWRALLCSLDTLYRSLLLAQMIYAPAVWVSAVLTVGDCCPCRGRLPSILSLPLSSHLNPLSHPANLFISMASSQLASQPTEPVK
jgi:hypothetical protein